MTGVDNWGNKIKACPRSKYQMKNAEDIPALDIISRYWGELVLVYRRTFGDEGSCVLGAGFTFTYKGEWYFLSAPRFTQGSVTWEHFKQTVGWKLKAIEGVDNVGYEWGNMD